MFKKKLLLIAMSVTILTTLVAGCNSTTTKENKDKEVTTQEEKPKEEVKEPNETEKQLEKVKVKRVVDGDTIETENGMKVRFIGVNTPESTTKTEPYGKEASNYTKQQLEGKEVYLQKDVSDKDQYSRFLRVIWLEVPSSLDDENEIRAKMFNAKLLLDGYAEPSTYAPDVRYSEMFRKFGREARESKKGLWNIDPTNGTTKGDLDTEVPPKVEAPKETPKPTPAPPSTNTGGTVYWTPNGKSYHATKSCKTLARSKTINQGTQAQSGKSDPCDVCH